MATAADHPGAAPQLSLEQAGSLAQSLEGLMAGSRLLVGAELGAMTTYRVGGGAALLAEVDTETDLDRLATVVSRERLDVSVIGRGSNMLVADSGFGGIAVHLGDAFAGVESIQAGDRSMVRVGGAASLPVLARQLTAQGLRGFEWAVGVPGSVGGAVRMNAGGHGSDMAASVRGVTYVDLGTGETLHVDPDELEFGYRTSAVRPRHVVTSVELELEQGDPVAGQALVAEIVRWRRENQPGGQNAGSVFTNPPDDSAGRLIDTAGLKGLRMGTAEVSAKHANFIQADVGGRAADIVALMQEIVRRVFDRFGVVLHAETRMLGFGPQEHALMFEPEESP